MGSLEQLCKSLCHTEAKPLYYGKTNEHILFGIAFSLTQNGEVFVFTGMLNTVADLNQLAIIIGHEMAHAVLGHSVSASLSAGPCCVFMQHFLDYDNALRQRLGNEAAAQTRIPTVDV